MKHDRKNVAEARHHRTSAKGRPRCCADEGRNGDKGRSKWKRKDARCERRVGKQDLSLMTDTEDAPMLKVPSFSHHRPNRKVHRRS